MNKEFNFETKGQKINSEPPYPTQPIYDKFLRLESKKRNKTTFFVTKRKRDTLFTYKNNKTNNMLVL